MHSPSQKACWPNHEGPAGQLTPVMTLITPTMVTIQMTIPTLALVPIEIAIVTKCTTSDTTKRTTTDKCACFQTHNVFVRNRPYKN